MDAYELMDVAVLGDGGKPSYHEFLRAPSMSVGVYRLGTGSVDPQSPHTEDEVYYVAAGQGAICVGAEDRRVRPGSIVYVKAGVDHRFHDIREDLVILVFFAPAEGTAAAERS